MPSRRVLNREISQDNIRAALELFFRQASIINDDETVSHITFATIKNPTTIVEWESMKTVPIQIVTKKDEVQLI